jgi:DNA-binding FadR family transcriptional regulator
MQESIVDQATEAIREYVISRGLAPGQRLPSERDLAESLGTSRPALREAIRRLESEHVIDVRGRSGMYIATLDMAEVFAVRLQLEPLAAQLTASRRTADELRGLQAMVAELRRAMPDPAGFSSVDRRLHAAVAKLGGNAVLADFILQLNDLTLISRGTTVRAEATRTGTLADMERLVSAIRRRDGDAAALAMRVHLQRIEATAAGEPFAPPLPQRLSLRR